MAFSGYIIALVVGLIMGLIGGGGSILTLPVLVYIMGIQPKSGTTYSLMIVGITALIAGIQKARQQQVSFKTVLLFGLPSLLSVYLTRQFLLPLIPETVVKTHSFTLLKDQALMILFAIIMILSAISMLKSNKKKKKESDTIHYGMVVLEGLFVGSITGLVGVGGGFLIIPALTLFARIPMKIAVGSSLMIIAINSAVGFIGDLQNTNNLDWMLLIKFTALSVLGSLLGNKLAENTDNQQLKRYFAWFVLVMGLSILFKELFF